MSQVGILAMLWSGRWSSRTPDANSEYDRSRRGWDINSSTPSRAAVAQIASTNGFVSGQDMLIGSLYISRSASPTMSSSTPQRYLFGGGEATYCLANHVLPRKYGSLSL